MCLSENSRVHQNPIVIFFPHWNSPFCGHTLSLETLHIAGADPESLQECLSIAAWFGMAYAHEWLKQYLHGAQPEELASVPASISMPKHWKQQQMPAQGWRLESVKSDIFRKLQGVPLLSFRLFGFSSPSMISLHLFHSKEA